MDVRAKQRLSFGRLSLNFELREFGFAPRHLNRSVFLGYFNVVIMLEKLFWQTSFSLMLFLCCASSALACSCDEINYRREFAKAKVVFIGEALEYKDNPNVKQDGFLIVKFKVVKSWKGAKQPEITIPTTFGLACGFYVEPGKDYLVYAYGEKMVMPTACSPSRTIFTDDDYEEKQFKQLNSSLFRFFSRIFPF